MREEEGAQGQAAPFWRVPEPKTVWDKVMGTGIVQRDERLVRSLLRVSDRKAIERGREL